MSQIKDNLIRKLLTVCLLWLAVLLICSADYDTGTEDDSCSTDGDDGTGDYFLLRTKEDFERFISEVNSGNTDINVRLCNNLMLNDISDWENWADSPPENIYHPMRSYNGHFDGGGFSLMGYYSAFEDAPSWQCFLFTTLEKDARISDLNLCCSFFRTTFEDCSYEDEDGSIDVVPAASLCFSNEGLIENCNIHAANIQGAWDAGGIAAINYGRIIGCYVSGSVEGGLASHIEKPETRLGSSTLYAGGICYSNQGLIQDCTNRASVSLHTLPADYLMTYAVGGIAGRNAEEGRIEDSGNVADITGVQLAGGIAGANWGEISRCVNNHIVHVEQPEEWGHTDSFISAGICASNGGTIDTCVHIGDVTINQHTSSFYAPIYGIACNLVNPDKGSVQNSYYWAKYTEQAYRQSGVHKISQREAMLDVLSYLDGTKKKEDVDSWELYTALPSYPGTDSDDYIHLRFGPPDVTYEVQEGDTLWDIAERYYDDGSLYKLIRWRRKPAADTPLVPGKILRIPCVDYYLLRTNDEQGHGWSACVLPSGETCPTRFNAAKPIDWYYGYADIEAAKGFDVMWPKDKGQGHDVPASDIRIFYRLDGNPEGYFFDDWEAVQKSIRKAAKADCGDAVDSLRFYRYTLDSGERLYGFSFRLYRPTDTLQCAAFYRIKKGFLAEYVGVAPIGEEEPVLERVRYLAAEIVTDSVLSTEEVQSDCEAFYGQENWDFPLLHNPFTTALAYDKDAECTSYMLFTGAQ